MPISLPARTRFLFVAALGAVLLGAFLFLVPEDVAPKASGLATVGRPTTGAPGNPAVVAAPASSAVSPIASGSEEQELVHERGRPDARSSRAAKRNDGVETLRGGWVERVRGVVVDPTGSPRAGARVELVLGQREAPRGTTPSREPPVDEPRVGGAVAAVLERGARAELRERGAIAVTRVDGAFEVEVHPERLWRLDALVVAADDPLDGSVALVRYDMVPPCEGVLDLGRLLLRPTLRLALLVRSNGRPLEGVQVMLDGMLTYQEHRDWQGLSPLELRARTDAAGAVTFIVPAGAKARIVLHAEGYASAVRRPTATHGLEQLVVDLAPGQELQGVVRGPEGKPVGRAHLRARPSDSAFASVNVRSDEEGRFALQSLAAGVVYEVLALDVTGVCARTAARVIPPAPFLELSLPAAGSILLTLTPSGEDRGWARFAEVILERRTTSGWERAQWLDPEAFADGVPRRVEENQRALLGLPPAVYRVRASDAGAWSTSEEVQVRVGEETAVAMRLEKGRTLRGRLVDVVQQPVPETQITVTHETEAGTHRLTIRTDDQGCFALEDLPFELEEVVVTREGFGPRALPVSAAEDLGDVLLAPGSR